MFRFYTISNRNCFSIDLLWLKQKVTAFFVFEAFLFFEHDRLVTVLFSALPQILQVEGGG